MKVSTLALSTALAMALGAAGFVPQVAHAATGTITINGKVIAPTCSVSNGSSGDQTVTLANVLTTDFNAAGDTSKPKAFELDLTDCPTNPGGTQVAAKFSGGNIDGTHAGTLANTVTSGSNVAVQLTDGSGTAINLSSDPIPVWATISGSGTATLKYQARYYAATMPVTGGNVSTSVEYTLVYQ